MNFFYPLQKLADWLAYSALNLPPQSLAGKAVNFFLFDSAKIFILLAVIIFAVSVARTFLPPEKIRHHLSRKNQYTGNVLASVLGIFTPFCTCSAIPLFLGFVQAGVPLGVTFSFLVASPMINEVALVLLLGLFGWKIAALYVSSGVVIAILSGAIIGRLKPESLLESSVTQKPGSLYLELPAMGWPDRLNYAKTYTADILKKVWPYVLLGIGIGAFIHGYVPADFLARYAGSGKWYAVPLAVIIGIPLYSNAAGVIPLVSALTQKGVALGTSLAFMMSVTALSLPEFLILKKVMKARLIAIFAGVVGAGIVATGYLFNWII